MPARRQSADDACPGALRLHAAADGPLARVRLPGGMLSGRQLGVLAELAIRWGDGALELTSRANIQLRAMRAAPEELATRLAAAGLLPSLAHETVRNIAAPPLAGPATRGLVEALDRGLCADPALAALPGRFLFAIGHTALSADVAAVPADPQAATEAAATNRPEAGWAMLLAGVDLGVRVVADEVVPALLAAAHAFLAERAGRDPRPWRLRELPNGPALVAARLRDALAMTADDYPGGGQPAARPTPAGSVPAGRAFRTAESPSDDTPTESPSDDTLTESPSDKAPTESLPDKAPTESLPDDARAGHAGTGPGQPLVGVLGQPGSSAVAVGALVPLRRLTRVPQAVLARAERLAVTPSGGIVVLDLAPPAADRWVGELRDAGLATEPDSKWAGVTTCAGRPGCGKALADVRADAEAAARFVNGRPVHWVGCERGCGSPGGEHVRVEATAGGYLIDGEPARGDLGEAVAARRV